MANDVDSSVQRSGKEAGRVKWIKKTATISSSLATSAAAKNKTYNRWNKSCEYFNFFNLISANNNKISLQYIVSLRLCYEYWISGCCLIFGIKNCFLLSISPKIKTYFLFCVLCGHLWEKSLVWNMVWNCQIIKDINFRNQIKIVFITTGNTLHATPKTIHLFPFSNNL